MCLPAHARSRHKNFKLKNVSESNSHLLSILPSPPTQNTNLEKNLTLCKTPNLRALKLVPTFYPTCSRYLSDRPNVENHGHGHMTTSGVEILCRVNAGRKLIPSKYCSDINLTSSDSTVYHCQVISVTLTTLNHDHKQEKSSRDF